MEKPYLEDPELRYGQELFIVVVVVVEEGILNET
jgi:hypothetical protein